ncbi:MAG TPA: FAD-dependent oxidoreductase [Stellaceae bacterium]|nr:FAD-dependent oxidoreductase [Stellaceae bacterium]
MSDYDIAVVGGGIAGLSAGLTAARLGRRTLILTGDILGGQLLSIAKVDGYPGFPDGVPGYDLCPMAQEMAVAAGAEIAPTELARLAPANDGFRVATEAGEAHAARGVIMATGARLNSLGVPGEAELTGKGVSHCATCDGPLLRGRVAAVVGGGDSAAQEALTLAEYDARVVMLVRAGELSAQAIYRDKILAEPRIELRCNTVVAEICGADKVTGLRVRDAGGAASEIEAAAVFVYVGLSPNSAVLQGLAALDASGAVMVDSMMRSPRQGLAAAGAVRSQWPGRAVASAGDGATAALAIDRFLRDGTWHE